MRCNPTRWLWGLLPIAIWTWITILAEHERIEADLSTRTAAALSEAGLGWVKTGFLGRDGIITGQGNDSAGARKAVDVARSVWGSRIVDDKTQSSTPARPGIWSASLRADRLKLAGSVPNEQVQQAIMGVARAAFPKIQIDDRTKVRNKSAALDPWLGGVSFALKQLATLKRGNVYLDGLDLAIAGEAESSAAYKSLKGALKGAMPAGVTLVSDKVVPPVARPFAWQAKLADNQMTFSGHVPDEAVRAKLFAQAKSALPTTALVDRTEVASGAPGNWPQAVEVVLGQLAKLQTGTASINDTDVALAGVADDEPEAALVRGQVRNGVPKGYQTSFDVAPARAPLERVALFVTRISLSLDGLQLTGHAPSEASRSSLGALLKARFPGKAVQDKLTLGSGATEGWDGCLAAGVAGLGKLSTGELTLTGRRLELSGQADNQAVADALSGELKAGVNQSCDPDVRVAVAARPLLTFSWRATRADDGGVALEGQVPGASVRRELVELARTLFPRTEVADRMTVVEQASETWSQAARTALRVLVKLRRGAAAVAGDGVSVEGEAADSASALAITELLERGLPRGYARRNAIQVKADPSVAGSKPGASGIETSTADTRSTEDAARDQDRQRIVAAEEARLAELAVARREIADRERLKRQAEKQKAKSPEQVAALERRQKAEAERCQSTMSSAASQGVIQFDRSSADLDPASFPTLEKLAKAVETCPEARIEIRGHTDAEGTPQRNMKLSERRAQSIVQWLTKAGIDASRLKAVGFGETRPVASNETAADRARNRRIEFSVMAN